ncbi:hypothetical protein DSO57_1014955 [Entomophthora muscae]|uniref:Uncharacterized protein n=1 Tax=Entomophthora muscae TaxID=34485 RepID=A0ACC2TG48_9FUNG|nr:hypothetical protein DSO57_1014955 [Entomophthora muscae]
MADVSLFIPIAVEANALNKEGISEEVDHVIEKGDVFLLLEVGAQLFRAEGVDAHKLVHGECVRLDT